MAFFTLVLCLTCTCSALRLSQLTFDLLLLLPLLLPSGGPRPSEAHESAHVACQVDDHPLEYGEGVLGGGVLRSRPGGLQRRRGRLQVAAHHAGLLLVHHVVGRHAGWGEGG